MTTSSATWYLKNPLFFPLSPAGCQRALKVGENTSIRDVLPTNKHACSSFISLLCPPPIPPFSISQGRDRTQRNLCLSCTGREQTNRGLLWPLISRSYAAPVRLQTPNKMFECVCVCDGACTCNQKIACKAVLHLCGICTCLYLYKESACIIYSVCLSACVQA